MKETLTSSWYRLQSAISLTVPKKLSRHVKGYRPPSYTAITWKMEESEHVTSASNQVVKSAAGTQT